MSDEFDRDVAVVGAGRIGLPWAAVLAAKYHFDVTCIDIDEERVETIRKGKSPFREPEFPKLLEQGRSTDALRATTEAEAVRDHEYVAITINAPRNEMHEFMDIVRAYSDLLGDDQVVVVRTTLPVGKIERVETVVENCADGSPTFVVFPERLAEGKAVKEIKTLPKIVGVRSQAGEAAIRDLLDPIGSPVHMTNPETAMFVKLIDNSYRDSLFAISNQIAYAADQLGLDGHEAIKLANTDYPRNDISSPGVVGGKCLPKDTHFLMDETICEQPTTPDLFQTTRRTNAFLPSYLITQILQKRPDDVTVLGIAYKQDVEDIFNSPIITIVEALEEQGVDVTAVDPNVPAFDHDIGEAISGTDVVVLGMNHTAFDEIEPVLNEHAPDASVFDVWGFLDESLLEVPYDGFGVN